MTAILAAPWLGLRGGRGDSLRKAVSPGKRRGGLDESLRPYIPFTFCLVFSRIFFRSLLVIPSLRDEDYDCEEDELFGSQDDEAAEEGTRRRRSR